MQIRKRQLSITPKSLKISNKQPETRILCKAKSVGVTIEVCMCVQGQPERAGTSYDTIEQAVSFLKMTVTKMTLRFGFFFFDC